MFGHGGLVARLVLSTFLTSCGGPPGATSDGGSDDVGVLDDAELNDDGELDGGAPTLIDDPLGPVPEQLSRVGLFLAPGDLDRVTARAHHYTPRYPLWSNGSEKIRHVVLPAGAEVDTSDPQWRYPAGTLFFKTFAYVDAVTSELLPVETRMLRRHETGWDYSVYRWNEDGTDAILLPANAPVTVEIEDVEGAVEHEIPNRLQCRTCHESAEHPVLGFTATQLAPETDDETGQLTELAEAELFSDAVPEEPVDLGARDAREAAVIGWVQGNCVHCHNGGAGPSSAFDLRFEVFLENTIGQAVASSGAPPGIRVVPGEPDESILYRLVAGLEELSMPPLGVQRPDDSTIEELSEWIREL